MCWSNQSRCPAIHEISVYSSITSEMRKTTMPALVISRRGLTEKLVMPSMAKASIFLRGYLLSPAKRSLRS